MTGTFHSLVFLLFAALAIGSAGCVVFMNNLLHAAVALFFSLTGVAGLYLTMGADFLGVIQLLVYAGGILVLLIFGIFLTSNIQQTSLTFKDRAVSWITGLFIAAAMFVSISGVISSFEWPTKTPVYADTVAGIGDLFLSKYLLPFELISLLLLFAMIGSVMLVKKDLEEPR